MPIIVWNEIIIHYLPIMLLLNFVPLEFIAVGSYRIEPIDTYLLGIKLPYFVNKI